MLSQELVNVSLTDVSTVRALQPLVQREGFAVVPACLGEGTVDLLCKDFDDSRYPERNILSVPSVHELASSQPVRQVMESILGPHCSAVRGIFFNTTPSSTWTLASHQ